MLRQARSSVKQGFLVRKQIPRGRRGGGDCQLLGIAGVFGFGCAELELAVEGERMQDDALQL